MYVDDILLTGVEGQIEECNKHLAIKFDMKDLGLMHHYLGLEVWQGPIEIYLGQGKYVIKIFKSLCTRDCKPMTILMINSWKD